MTVVAVNVALVPEHITLDGDAEMATLTGKTRFTVTVFELRLTLQAFSALTR